MKVLFAVLSCNRLFYIKNCIDSILKFNDPEQYKLLIVDNNSVEIGAAAYLSNISKVCEVHSFDNRTPNELYRAMNFAIRYAIKNEIDIVNFIQDDYQHLYTNPDLIPSVIKLMKNKRIVQVSTNLVWRRKKVGRFSIQRQDDINFAILEEKVPCDSGFTRVSVYKKIGLYPQDAISYDQNSSKTLGFGKDRYKNKTNGEIWFGNRCRKEGFSRAICMTPNTAMLFDCAYVRGMQRFGRYFPPPEEFYLKPFSVSEINKISKNNKHKKFSFIEDMIEPWGWQATTADKHNREKIIESIL